MRNKILFLLCFMILAPSFSWAMEPTPNEIKRVIKNGYLYGDNLNLGRNINRAELSTVVVRILDLEDEAKNFKCSIPFEDVKNFQKGWATPYVALAYKEGIIRGVNPTTFNPKGEVSYVEMLTIFMRILGYQDGIDFVDYPEGYYTKAVEIGLGNLYMDMDKNVTRGDVALTIEKLLDLPMKGDEIPFIEKFHKKPKPVKNEQKIRMNYLKFNTSITGIFKGQLKGREDFSGYTVELLSKYNTNKEDTVYDKVEVGEDGIFKIWNFDIGWVAKFRGYKYKVYDEKGNLVLEDNLK